MAEYIFNNGRWSNYTYSVPFQYLSLTGLNIVFSRRSYLACHGIIYNNYSMNPSWIWSDKIPNERVARVGYNHFISNKGECNNCFSKFSNRVLPPIFTKRPERAHNFRSHAPRPPPSPDYYITKSWMKVTATQTTICQLVAKTKLELFYRSNTR